MFLQTGRFNGIGTCSATRFIILRFYYTLSAGDKTRSIVNIPYINAHLRKLGQENIISVFVEIGKREFAARFSSNIDYHKYSMGEIFVSL